jgi:competence protein ComFC
MSALSIKLKLMLGFKFLLNWLLPFECVLCHRPGSLLCQNCYQLIQFYPSLQPQQLQVHQGIDAIYVLAYYQPPIKNLIQALKYQRVKAAAKLLAELVYWHLNLPKVDLVCFVPSSQLRLSNRGFNQTRLICNHLAQLLNIKTLPVLQKTKATARQASLKKPGERLKNLHQVFELSQPELDLTNKHVLLIDDVISTGATVSQCARVLKQAGTRTVSVLALARS